MSGTTRRHVLAALFLSACLPPGDALGAPGDQGIGGTGRPSRRRPEPGTDHGIGGTGIVGIVRGFGSIVVNGLHVSYPRDVAVFYDNRPAAMRNVRIGQAVSVVALRSGDALRTARIDISSEVSGTIERRRDGGFVVLGQIVRSPDPAVLDGFEPGDRVAVHGLRRLDGSIEATLVEAMPAGTPDRLVGPVNWRGRAMIGALPIEGVGRALAGRRIAVEGQLRDGRLRAVRIGDPLGDLAAKVDRVLVETYVGASNGAFALGTGFPVRGRPFGGPRPGPETRGVLSATIGGDGRLHPDSLRADPDKGPQGDDRRPGPGRDPGPGPSPDRAPPPDGADQPPAGADRPPGGFGGGGNDPPGRETGRNSRGDPPGRGGPRGGFSGPGMPDGGR